MWSCSTWCLLMSQFHKSFLPIESSLYDVDNKDSFASLVHWEEEMKKFGVAMARVKTIVCGNKCDTKGRQVSLKDAQAWCSKRGC